MKFDIQNKWDNVGEKIGFLLGYFIFTTVLFFLTKKPYLFVMGITFTITLIGLILKRLLK
jgi:hypothetical protein